MPGHPHPVDPDRVRTAQAQRLPPAEAEELSRLLTTLGDPVRCRVLAALLAIEELCVGDVVLAADITEDAATYALRLLRMAGLVRRRREGRFGYYRISDDETREELAAALGQLRHIARSHPQRSAAGPQPH